MCPQGLPNLITLRVTKMMNKKDYIFKIQQAESSKDLYSICNKLLNREQESVLPAHDCAKTLPYRFITHFNDKITYIRVNLENESRTTASDTTADITTEFVGTPLKVHRNRGP